MRIISGSKRGKKLFALEGTEVRPTSDRVKEALFDILQSEAADSVFLDLFAGSGQVGLEAVSRGGKSAVFVDASPKSVRIIEKNIAATGFGDFCRVVNRDFEVFLATDRERFDIAFLDPPYGTGQLQKALELVASHMKESGVIACEHPSDEALPEKSGDFLLRKTYRYGKIALSVYRTEKG